MKEKIDGFESLDHRYGNYSINNTNETKSPNSLIESIKIYFYKLLKKREK